MRKDKKQMSKSEVEAIVVKVRAFLKPLVPNAKVGMKG